MLGQAVVHPVFGEWLCRWPISDLGQLVFVMGEHQVHAAAVDVEGLAEVFHAHGRAFDMPAGPALAPGESHAGSPGLAAFQKAKSAGLRLPAPSSCARARFLVLDVAVGELAVIGVVGHVEPDVAVGGIGEPCRSASGTSR